MSWNNPIPWNSRTDSPVPVEGMSSGAANAASVGRPPNKSLLAGLISGGASVAASGINYFSQQATNRSNERMNRENNDYNLRLWQMNNEYNTPANQRLRMEAAGFNPNLMYGSMLPGNSSEPAHSESHYNNAPQLADFGTAIGNAYQIYKQSQLMDKQIEAQELINKGQDIKNKQESKNLGWMDERRYEEQRAADDVSKSMSSQLSIDEFTKREISHRIVLLRSQKKLTDAEAAHQLVENDLFNSTFDAQVRKAFAEADLTEQQFKNLKQQLKNMIAECALLTAQGQMLNFDVEFIKNNKELWTSMKKAMFIFQESDYTLKGIENHKRIKAYGPDGYWSEEAITWLENLGYRLGRVISGALPILGKVSVGVK